MRFLSLQSGSNGNCLIVESGDVRLMFDAGLTGIQTKSRLESFGIDISTIQAVLLTHSHSDHTSGAGVLLRQHSLPLWMTPGTHRHVLAMRKVGQIGTPHYFRPGQTLRFGHITVETLQTAHDAPEPVCFVADDGKHRIGIMTDLGHSFAGLAEAIETLDGVLLESDYDPMMLKMGPYPLEVQDRIRSPQGHLSNFEAARLLFVAGKKLQWACLGHLSGNNNTPELALETHRSMLGKTYPVFVAPRDSVSEIFHL